MAKEKIISDITFGDCLESVRYEIEDALERFPGNKELFLHQVRLLLDSLASGTEFQPEKPATENPIA
jgi:hypothetical protein